VQVHLFATARVAVGTAHLSWPVPEEGTAARELLKELTTKYPGLRPIVTVSRFFLDGEALPGLDARIRPGHELAVHPHYGGG
jgi:molybdopterin converting factor small subunit